MPARLNLLGRRFGRLVVTGEYVFRSKKTYWPCTCDCGNKVTVRASYLLCYHSRSCGCYVSDYARSLQRTWSEEEFEFVRQNYKKIPTRDISIALDRTPRAVNAMVEKMGLSKPWRTAKQPPSEELYFSTIRRYAEENGVPLAKALSSIRSPALLRTRWAAWAELRAQKFTYKGIAAISGFDHATIMSGIERHAQIMAQQSEREAAE